MPPEYLSEEYLFSVPLTSVDRMIEQHKLCLIEDIFKVEELCHGLQIPDHDTWHRQPGKLFDYLYDCDIETLEMILATSSAQASQEARRLGGFYNNL